MTCVVGIEHKGEAWMGADSASASSWDIYPTRLKKVFKRGDFLIGYTTSFRMGQLLQYKLDVPKQSENEDDLEYMSTVFIDAVRECLRDGGFTEISNNVETGGLFMVGYKSKLYIVDRDFQVNSTMNGYYAIGVGGKYALGNLLGTIGLPPKHRIQAALDAATYFSNGVIPPYHILSI